MNLKKLFSMALVFAVCSIFIVQVSPAAAQTGEIVECPCKGPVNMLSLKNLGAERYFVMRKTSLGTIYFEGVVSAGGIFTGTNGGLRFEGGDTDIQIGPVPATPDQFTPDTIFTIHTSCSQPLNVGFVFPPAPATAEVQIVALNSEDGGLCPADCSETIISGSPTLAYSADTVTWEITHSVGVDWVMLDYMELNWPSSNGAVVSISMDGTLIWSGNMAWTGAPVTFTGWQAGTELARTLATGATKDIQVQFENTAASSGGGYYFNLVFYGTDCSVNAARVVSFGEAPAAQNHLPGALFLGGLISMLVFGFVTYNRKSNNLTNQGKV